MAFRPKYADVAATVALVLSLSGTAYAATVIYSANIADNTILGRDVHDGALTGTDVLNGSLTGADVKDGSLGLADISDSAEATLKGQKGDKGDPGTPGLPGDPGKPGDAGTPGISGYTVVFGEATYGAVGDVISAFALCPSGKKPLSGGWTSGTNNLPLNVRENHPRTLAPGEEGFASGGEAWQIDGRQVWSTGGSMDQWWLKVWAVCATVQ
jgi:hypothetical protein